MGVDSRVPFQTTAIYEAARFLFRVSHGAHVAYEQPIVSLATKR